jgi:phosphate transport system substrate-binding protein
MNGSGLKRLLAVVGIPLLGLLLIAAAKPVPLNGAGSTFINPILSRWVEDYASDYLASTGVKITYAPVGSGAGLEMIKAKKVDFAASDRPLSSAELAKHGLGQFPVVIGGVVPVVNIPGVAPGRMRFTGPVLADIYLGKITRWNDPAIQRLNPGFKLPKDSIHVVHRSDGSGTTFNWVNYFSKVSPEWKARVGEGTRVAWPVGKGAAGNDGVSVLVRRTNNSIGYVELSYVYRDGLAWALVKNRAGNFVAPNPGSFAAAVENVNWDAATDFNLVVTNAPGAGAYPITATTFVLAPKHPRDGAKSRALVRLFEWALFNGGPQASALGYVPLPRHLANRVQFYWTTEFSR